MAAASGAAVGIGTTMLMHCDLVYAADNARFSQEALDMGLVSKVVPLADLRAFAEGQAAKLAALPAATVRATKALMKRARTPAINDAMDAENKLFAAMLLAPEAKEAMTAFMEKRKPDLSQLS